MVSNKPTRLRSRQNSLTKNFKNVKFEIVSPRNSPVPQFKSDDDLNKIQRIHRMISNWLNGLPVKEIRTFDAESFGTRRRQPENTAEVVPSNALLPTTESGESQELTGGHSEVVGDQSAEAKVLVSPSIATNVPSHRQQPIEGKRTIVVNSELPPEYCHPNGLPMQTFIDNSIRTTKYNILSFIPLNLFAQFRRIANFYFLVMIILQTIPALTQVNPAVSALPLLCVVTITAVKDAIEDHRRYRSDRDYNNRKAKVFVGFDNRNGQLPTKKMRVINFIIKPFRWLCYRHEHKEHLGPQNYPNTSLSSLGVNFASSWKSVCWRDVHVGDIIYLRENDPVPADVVLLTTSEEDSICYVETKDLDGESALKIKKTPLAQLEDEHAVDLLHTLHEFTFRVDCENPASNLFSFSGNLYARRNDQTIDAITDDVIAGDADVMSFPLDIDNLLLRGSCVKNTHYAVGIVVYTGRESKIMLNSGGNKFKRSQIEYQLNPMIILNLCLLFMLCLTVAIIRTTITGSPENTQAPYSFSTFSSKYGQKNSFLSGLIAFFSCVLAIQALVPISLYITVEFVRTVQAWFIYNDIDLYNEELDKRCLPKAWNLSDDLGQIEYIFSDKTGTLTKNVMKLRQFSINGKVYGKYELGPVSPTSTVNPNLLRMEIQQEQEAMIHCMNQLFEPLFVTKSYSLVDSQLFVDISQDDAHSNSLVTFFQVLTLCHTAMAKIQPNQNDESLPSIEYHSQSPDEIALLEACKDLGFVFVKKDRSTITLSIMGEELVYKVLNIIEFSSSRKRMSVIVEDAQGRIMLLCKGADSVIYERLEDQENELSVQTLENLQNFAEKGLRTLCIAYRELSEYEYSDWAKAFFEAQSALENRAEHMEEVAESIEHDLILLGATAVEDELQDKVPESIETLERAGIKLWVLTGDKVETAINIGFSCNLLNRNMNLIVVRGQTQESISFQLETIVKDLWYECLAMEEDSVEPTFALVIDGTSLKHAISEERNRRLFVCISGFCKSVICCRVSPLQKAKVVELIKHYKNATTLAIGDGANDVSMIKTANVGVGLFGREGVQASMASDYAITEFRHLVKLLLVHGRWSYWRTALTVLTSLFRNLIFTSIIFYFQFFCLFTASSAYDYVFGLLYNLIFVVLPSVAIGIFESDLTAKYCINVPQLYQAGIKKSMFNIRKYLLFMFQGVYITLICYFFTMIIFNRPGANGYYGHTLDLFQFGSMLVVEIVFIANIFTTMHISNWNIWVQVALWGNMLILFAFFVVYSFVVHGFMHGQFLEVFGTPLFYFTFALILAFSFGPTFLYKYLENEFFPRDVDIVRDIQNTKRNEAALFQSCMQSPHYQLNVQPSAEEFLTSPEIQTTVPDTMINPLEKLK